MNCLLKPLSIILLSFTVLWGCQSVAVFPQCNGEKLEPGEECELYMNGESEAEKVCRDLGYPSGRHATCDDRTCRWDTASCELATNNINNCTIECDPLNPFASCGGEGCYFDQNTSCATCHAAGTRPVNDSCGDSWQCAPGLTCLWGVCTKMCDRFEESICDQGLPCYDPGWPNIWGFCPLVGDDVCDPISGDGCPDPDHGCYVVDENGISFTTACLHSTNNTGECMEDEPYSDNYFNQCSPGYFCVGSNCRKFCFDLDDCHSGTCVLVYEGYLDDIDVMVCM